MDCARLATSADPPLVHPRQSIEATKWYRLGQDEIAILQHRDAFARIEIREVWSFKLAPATGDPRQVALQPSGHGRRGTLSWALATDQPEMLSSRITRPRPRLSRAALGSAHHRTGGRLPQAIVDGVEGAQARIDRGSKHIA